MQDVIIGAVVVVGACLAIAAGAVALVVFGPKGRRRRRHRQHSKRPKIDLFEPPKARASTEDNA